MWQYFLLVCMFLEGAVAWADHDKPISKSPLITRTYRVADLVVPIDTERLPDASFDSPLRYLYRLRPSTPSARFNRAAAPLCLSEPLIELIRSRVAPASWEGRGGRGAISFVPENMSLQIQQSEDGHQAIDALLSELHRQVDLQVSVQLRLLVLPAGSQQVPASGGFLSFDDQELRRFLTRSQSRPDAVTIQLPRITLANAQAGTLTIDSSTADLQCSVQPVVSGDGHHVSLRVTYAARHFQNAVETVVLRQDQASTPAKPQVLRLAAKFTVPDGRTAVLPVKGPDHQVLLLVTPRVCH
ncbi:MAG: hypothetical protein FJ271_19710 [Planctomycetes bacterium]|nr:hypothetical protein [Planctomycetota bacterium]